MKKFTTIALAIGLAFAGSAQDRAQGGISPDMMRQIVSSSQAHQNKAISNAMAANSIDDLAQNYRNTTLTDTYFSIETPKQSIHNQRQSGRCWMYSSFNVLRANFARRHGDSINVEFSHDYLFFYDQLEKANLMLQGVIDCADKPIDDTRVQFFFHHPINDGGTFCGVADLAEKYGLVPVEAQPETYSAERTSRMSQLVASKLREFGLELRQMVADKKSKKAIGQRKTQMLGTIYSMLSLTLGEPIKSFTYAFRDKNGKAVGPARTYTPLEFYRETVGGPINGTFIMAMNDPAGSTTRPMKWNWTATPMTDTTGDTSTSPWRTSRPWPSHRSRIPPNSMPVLTWASNSTAPADTSLSTTMTMPPCSAPHSPWTRPSASLRLTAVRRTP